MPPITTRHELTFHSGRMHPARVRSSGSERLSPNRSSAAYTIDMHESDFSEATGAPRIHGELLKLGFEVAESTVSKYMIGRRGPPSQSWRTFLRNHADAIAAIDLRVVPTLTFERLFAFLVVGHGRRQLLWFAVTRNPSAQWLAQQMAEAFPWNTAPTY